MNTTAATQESLSRPDALFDRLEAVSLDFMLGRWRGEGLPSGHPMDGLLEAFHWYGKEFVDPDHVHPLLFRDDHGRLYKVNPARVPLQLAVSYPVPKNRLMRRLFWAMQPVMRTSKSKARLRMLEHRGKVSATMIYDNLPINDIFRKIDENTVLGLMDLKGMEQPFFFILHRESAIVCAAQHEQASRQPGP